MKQNMFKRFVAGCLLLTTLLTCTEWPVFSPTVPAEAATHTHTDDCYNGTKHSHDGTNSTKDGVLRGFRFARAPRLARELRFTLCVKAQSIV